MYWNVSVGLKCVRMSKIESGSNLSPLKKLKVASVSEILAVNVMVGRCLLASCIPQGKDVVNESSPLKGFKSINLTITDNF